MKYINYLASMVLLAGFAACNEPNDLEDQGFTLVELPPYVAFNAPGETVENPVEDVVEGGSVDFTVEVPVPTTSDITVDFSFGGDAVFGTDFTIPDSDANGGTIVIPNQTSGLANDFDNVDIPVTILNNGQIDPDGKTLTITLAGATNADGETFAVGRGGLDTLRTATVNITDQATEAAFGSSASSVTEGDTISIPLGIDAELIADEVTISGRVEYFNTTADDFSNPASAISTFSYTLAAGDTAIEFPTVRDLLVEEGDSALLIITEATAVSESIVTSIGTDSVTFTIEDVLGEVAFTSDVADTTTIETGVGRSLSYPVGLSNASIADVTVNYTVSSAGGVTDLNSGAVTISAGETSTSIDLAVDASASESMVDITIDSIDSDDEGVSLADDQASVINLVNP